MRISYATIVPWFGLLEPCTYPGVGAQPPATGIRDPSDRVVGLVEPHAADPQAVVEERPGRPERALQPSLFQEPVAAEQQDSTHHARLSSLLRIDQCDDERVQDQEERPVHRLARDVLERPAQGEDPHRERARGDDRLREGRPLPRRRGLLPGPQRRERQTDAEGDPEDRLPRNVARARDQPGDGHPGGHDVRRDVLDHLVEIAIDLDGRCGTRDSLRPGQDHANSTAHWALRSRSRRSQGASWIYTPDRRWGIPPGGTRMGVPAADRRSSGGW